ncbi:MAG: beta-lactamase family protein [Caulobacteraceae bacterium]|nr:beta-lactamase family protein [Caulobacteraceae bacterium]
MDGATAPRIAFDTQALTQAPAALEAAIESGDLSGAVTLVWREGEIAQLETIGRRNVETGAPMTRDTLFRIASMTKPVTSAAALMLMEEGKLALGDPITKWAPEFADMRVLKSAGGPLEETCPALREITIEDLLTHRAGLAYGFTSVGPIAKAHDDVLGDVMNVRITADAWMKALGGLPLSYPPGERFHYSHATDVLGFLLGRIEGKDIRDVLMERIFAPLGMVDTDFFFPPAKRDRAAVVYRLNEETGVLAPLVFDRHDEPPAFCGGGGGLVSTADDYLKFARMLLKGGELDGTRLLEPETVALMRTNRLTDTQREVTFLGIPFWLGQGFGLGVSMITDPEKQAWMGAGSRGAFGWPGAFGTWWQADPEEDMIILYLIQNSVPLGPELAVGQRMEGRLALPMFQKAVYAALGK